eukprot:3020028-Pyramimonas_sp.AAC.1
MVSDGKTLEQPFPDSVSSLADFFIVSNMLSSPFERDGVTTEAPSPKLCKNSVGISTISSGFSPDKLSISTATIPRLMSESLSPAKSTHPLIPSFAVIHTCVVHPITRFASVFSSSGRPTSFLP